MTRTKRTALAGLLGLAAFLPFAASAQVRAPLMHDPNPSTFRVAAPPDVVLRQKGLAAAQATFQVNYLAAGANPHDATEACVAWSAQAKAAFDFAASVWASQIQSPVPITIDACYASSMDPGVLGAAGPYRVLRNFAGAADSTTWYPVALANALAGMDLLPPVTGDTRPDIVASFSSTFNWYYGTDGNTPFSQVDFVSVVLHEIGHGLGFVGSMDYDDVTANGSWGLGSGFPFRYDRFTVNAADQALTNVGVFGNPSVGLGAVLRSNAVFFSGTNANAANGNAKVPLYAPATWSSGSSYSHLAESFNNTPNALMTYSLANGESIHSPGPVTLGLLKDLGWRLQTASTADLSVTQTIGPNPASTGKDVVFTMTVTNAGPGTATGVALTAAYDAGASAIWASPGCTAGAGTFTCTVGTMGNGATSQYRIVLRKGSAGTVSNTASVTSSTIDANAANDSSTAAVTVNASPAGVPVLRYRLYSPITLEHHFTTDLNEYTVLGASSGAWIQEGTVGKVLDNPGGFNGVTATPYYRLYNTLLRWHHWTTDPNEYYTLGLYPGWNQEGVDGYLLLSAATGATQLYRLVYPNGTGLHHWTVDANEYATLIGVYGWVGEGGTGFVIE